MATIRDTILEYPSLSDMEGYLEKVVSVKRDIDLYEDCTPENIKQVELCVADMYTALVNTQNFTEGKLSISNPRSYYIQTAKRLYLENGEPEKVANLKKNIIIRGNSRSRW